MTSRLMLVAILVIAAHLALTDAAVRAWGMRGFNLKGDPTGPPDPYLKVWCGSTFGGMTEFHKDNANPTWSAEFYFPNCRANDNLKLEVWDKDLNFDDHLGTCTSQVRSGTHVNINCIVGKGSLSYNFELK
ncbi:protein unc-13 homolog B-like [Colossoma macropomum]|uniref:protein unc-13 homolog B-like n=1 Tax=Colossoma macropomum TaxID=42526 RepID=UPI0018645C44|nr:protein unc-13 homolog B-like [Colossoma macropomum]XP_036454624.1 protein unc-13 homolog B-like [Colossoma macropomum]